MWLCVKSILCGNAAYRAPAQEHKVVNRVAKVLEMTPGEILRHGKQPERVRARSLVCYSAVKELGMSGSAVAKLLGIIQSSVSRGVQRGEKLALENQYSLQK